ncbi:hypothetical protein INT44_005320 [Umbelopsis vinacea]|uniref:Uncharacterized protein n=1 Tax=Umbelopsis vinacea TaxID=44442 RepID=A0A8H7Q8R4_9FUNG|nr:hypothetical protein INT44_005320 [Umbelopsis vinacea]
MAALMRSLQIANVPRLNLLFRPLFADTLGTAVRQNTFQRQLFTITMDYEKRQLQQSQEGEGFIAAIKSEIFAPEKRQGNINIALSLTVFTGAIVFLRNFGDLLAV